MELSILKTLGIIIVLILTSCSDDAFIASRNLSKASDIPRNQK
jgi:hypothetical protein